MRIYYLLQCQKSFQEKPFEKEDEGQNNETDLPPKEIKNLPSTVVREQKVSFVNTFLVNFFPSVHNLFILDL